LTTLQRVPEVHPSARRSPLVIFAPAPPSKSGIATYVDELMPYHMLDFDVTLVLADDAALPEDFANGPRILLASEFRRHRSCFSDAPKMYHIGNNPTHCYMLESLTTDPGIVVLHDFNLNYLHQSATTLHPESRAYQRAMLRDYGVFGDDNIAWQSARQDREIFATYETPLNGAVLESAVSVIAHSRYVQYKAAARAPHVPVWYVPHHLSPQIGEFAQLAKSTARKRLGLPQQPLIITVLGFVTRAKKLHFSLKALAELRNRIPPFRFVIAGEQRPSEYDIAPQIESSGLRDETICTGYLEENEFFLHLAATDLIVNLRYPSGGETSGTLMRALSMGKPCIVFDDGPMGELPDAVVRKVPWGEFAQQEFTAALYDLLAFAPKRQALGANAAAYARKHLGIERIARKYADIVRSKRKRLTPPPTTGTRHYFPSPGSTARRVRAFEAGTAETLRACPARLWIASSAVPMGGNGRSAVVVSERPDTLASLLCGIFDWAPDSVTAITLEDFLGERVHGSDGRSVQSGIFDLALVTLSADMPENRCALLMRRINAVLRPGGSATIEVWQKLVDEVADPPLGEARLPDRLRDAGFSCIRRSSPADGIIVELVAPADQGDVHLRFACATAQKTSEMAVWRYRDQLPGFPAVMGRPVVESGTPEGSNT